MNTVEKWVDWVLAQIMTVALFAMFLVTFFAVFARDVLSFPSPWSDDLVRYMMIWMIYLGVAVVSVRKEHIVVDVMYSRLPRWWLLIVDIIVGLSGALVSGYVAYLGMVNTIGAFQGGQVSQSTYLPAWAGYLAVPVGLGFSALGFLWILSKRLFRKSAGHDVS